MKKTTINIDNSKYDERLVYANIPIELVVFEYYLEMITHLALPKKWVDKINKMSIELCNELYPVPKHISDNYYAFEEEWTFINFYKKENFKK